MTHTENSLSRLNRDDLFRLELDYQQKYDIILDKISKELSLAKAITSESQMLLLLRPLTSRLETRFLHWSVNAGAMLNYSDGKFWKYLEYQKILAMVS